MVAHRDLDDHRHQRTLRETGPSEFDVEGSLEGSGIEQAILKGDSRAGLQGAYRGLQGRPRRIGKLKEWARRQAGRGMLHHSTTWQTTRLAPECGSDESRRLVPTGRGKLPQPRCAIASAEPTMPDAAATATTPETRTDLIRRAEIRVPTSDFDADMRCFIDALGFPARSDLARRLPLVRRAIRSRRSDRPGAEHRCRAGGATALRR